MCLMYILASDLKKKSVAGAVSGGAGVCEQPPGYSRGLRATP